MRAHLFHDWSKWGEPFDSTSSDNRKCQARECSVCGKKQVAYVRSPFNWWYAASQITKSLSTKDLS